MGYCHNIYMVFFEMANTTDKKHPCGNFLYRMESLGCRKGNYIYICIHTCFALYFFRGPCRRKPLSKSTLAVTILYTCAFVECALVNSFHRGCAPLKCRKKKNHIHYSHRMGTPRVEVEFQGGSKKQPFAPHSRGQLE